MCICVCTKMQCTGVCEFNAGGEGGGKGQKGAVVQALSERGLKFQIMYLGNYLCHKHNTVLTKREFSSTDPKGGGRREKIAATSRESSPTATLYGWVSATEKLIPAITMTCIAKFTNKQLTKTLGSKHPAVDWKIVVCCSSVNFAMH